MAKRPAAKKTSNDRVEVSSEPRKSVLAAAETQAKSFRHVREARRNEIVDDYVELIADLIDHTGEARIVDIAAHLGVAQPTVVKMLKRLQQDELVSQRPYRGVFLTDAGRKLAEECRERHRVVEEFLLALGVSAKTARLDAEGIEHYVSDETLTAFRKYCEGR